MACVPQVREHHGARVVHPRAEHGSRNLDPAASVIRAHHPGVVELERELVSKVHAQHRPVDERDLGVVQARHQLLVARIVPLPPGRAVLTLDRTAAAHASSRARPAPPVRELIVNPLVLGCDGVNWRIPGYARYGVDGSHTEEICRTSARLCFFAAVGSMLETLVLVREHPRSKVWPTLGRMRAMHDRADETAVADA